MTSAAIRAERKKYSGSADLVLAGGGVKGIGHVGALEALEARGYDRFQRVVGTSVGAIVGALVAAGMPATEIKQHLLDFSFSRLRDPGWLDRIPLIGKPASTILECGVYEGAAVRNWLHDLLKKQEAETFAKLKARAGERLGRRLGPQDSPLVVLATDITRGRLVRLPTHYRPLYKLNPEPRFVADAVRASLSIPIFFEPVRLNGSLLVDGGVLSNYAIDLFDAVDPAKARWPTLGMTLLGPSESPALGRNLARNVFPPLRFVHGALPAFLENLIGTIVVGQDQHSIEHTGVAKRTIQINTDEYGIVEFDIGGKRKQELIERGRQAAETFLKDWDGDDGRAGSGLFPVPEGGRTQ